MGVFDDWLQDFKVLEEDDDDFSAADFFAAQETATQPIYVLTQEMTKRFGQWVNTLRVGSTEKPLEGMLRKSVQ